MAAWKQRQLQRQEVGWSIRLARQGVVGRKGDDRKALFQRQDSAEQLTSLPRRAVQLLATRSKSSVAKTCFPAGSLNLELQASSEVRATCGHDGCGAIVATGDGSGRGGGANGGHPSLGLRDDGGHCRGAIYCREWRRVPGQWRRLPDRE